MDVEAEEVEVLEDALDLVRVRARVRVRAKVRDRGRDRGRVRRRP